MSALEDEPRVPPEAHYRRSTDRLVSCGTCAYYDNDENVCMMFDDAPVMPEMVCDEFSAINPSDVPTSRVRPDDRYAVLTPDDINALNRAAAALEPGQVKKAKAGALYLVSHAKTRYNRPGQPHDIVHGWRDTPLDARGKQEAKRLGAFLRGRGVQAVHSSDLKRAAQTAEVIGQHAKAPVRTSRAYRPWNLGDFAGHSSADVIPKLKPFMGEKSDQPIDGGESFDTFKNRFIPALETLLKQAHAGRTVALVTHSRNIELAQGWLNGKGHRKSVDTSAISRDTLDPATVFKVSSDRGGKLRMKELADDTVRKADLTTDLDWLPVAAALLEPGFAGIAKELAPVSIRPLPPESVAELERFWAANPRLRAECLEKYGHDPVDDAAAYWAYGLAEPEHGDVLASVQANQGMFSLGLVRAWEAEEVAHAAVEKGTAHPTELNLRINGVHRHPSGHRVYRMVTRDGHYIGMTNPTTVRRRKGDVLKVQVNDLLQDAQGDLRWMNANVVSGYHDAPHSWREAQALAGGMLQKDTAPGPAGDIPPAGDEGTNQNTPSNLTLLTMEPAAQEGPTSRQVHVDVPLKNISQAYVGGRRKGKAVLRGEFLPISKEGKMKQLVYGVVLEPNSLDSQDDFMLPHHVEQTAHGYLKKAIRGKSSVAKLQHRAQGFFKEKPSICPVESFIAPVDFTYDGVEMIKKGSWVLCMHVEDPALWRDFLDGKYQAFSVGGSGVRQSMSSTVDLFEHDQIGRQQPNYFEPDPRRLYSPTG